MPRSDTWILLARALILCGREGMLDSEPARERVRAAVRRARESDIRGISQADIAEIYAQLA